MSTLISLESILHTKGYFIDQQTFEIWSFKRKNKITDRARLMMPNINSTGYVRYKFYINGKQKHYFLHQLIVWIFIDPNYDPKTQTIDHLDHNKLNNAINNLKVVSLSDNCKNKHSSKLGVYNYVDSIGKALIISPKMGIYYSIEYDKFYMYIEHINKYKELHECNHKNNQYVKYIDNNKQKSINVNKFKKIYVEDL